MESFAFQRRTFPHVGMIQLLSPRQEKTLEKESFVFVGGVFPTRGISQAQQILSPRPTPSYRKDMAVLFMSRAKVKQDWSLASIALRDAYTDFMLSRQAMNCTPSILAFNKCTVGKFLQWF